MNEVFVPESLATRVKGRLNTTPFTVMDLRPLTVEEVVLAKAPGVIVARIMVAATVPESVRFKCSCPPEYLDEFEEDNGRLDDRFRRRGIDLVCALYSPH